ncbi:spondin domain-containing protein [Vibrio diabolicus]|uniref:spondin domain-containing protein n=1 Tax=Vibrio diabolicus TaxID=50719 RepID=UPI00215CC240|nr:spondin domain-containing protein [Vibrio diabolicus]MCR9307379.1 spondin domain-containing protein [Vibrio diabolicus]
MKVRILLVAASVGLLAGCPSDDDNDVVKSYRYTVNVANLTANQPMSPLAVLTHNGDYQLFEIGQAASVELEHLAEGGSNAELIELVNSNDGVYQGISGNGLVLPGASDEVTITVDPSRYGYLSVASMFVNTNDAFVGETGLSLKSLAVGESYEMSMNVWDSGTELNDELAATIPGPAGGGEGFNAARNDSNDVVAFHAGVVSQDDGLANSALSANHRFLNPGAKVTITRVE